MLCNIKQSKAEARVNVFHSVMKVKLRGGSSVLSLQTVAKKMLTRVNKKKLSGSACICIVHGSTKEKSTLAILFQERKRGENGKTIPSTMEIRALLKPFFSFSFAFSISPISLEHWLKRKM